MSTLLLVLLVLDQQGGCDATAARAAVQDADRRVAWFDLAGAADRFSDAAALGCPEAAVAGHYLRGLIAARAAYWQGGAPASLAPVERALGALEAAAADGSAPAGIAGFVLRAAIAGAQSEREVMALYLEHALSLEALQLLAAEPGAPVLRAHEVAGDLWLQVHRYADARDAYLRAAEQIGRTPFVRLGLGRAFARLKDVPAACREYVGLITWWGEARSADTPEIAEARTFLRDHACDRPPAP